MSLENPFEGKKANKNKSPEPIDLGRTAVLEMPEGFEDELIKPQEDSEDEPIFEIDLDEVENEYDRAQQEAGIAQAREQIDQSMSGTTEITDTPTTKKLKAMTPEERIALAKNAQADREDSGIILEDSQGVSIVNLPSEVVPDFEFDLEKTQDLAMPSFNEKLKLEQEDIPGEIVDEYSELSREQIESLTEKLRRELVIIANESESAQEILEKQNAFIMEHAKKLGFPESLASRLVADGRRILPVAPLAVQGGMSAVFESLNLNGDADILFGTDTESNLGKKPQTDVLKVIYAANAKRSFLERFKQEAIATANLNTIEKRIVNVRDADFESPQSGYFMVLEKADGNDLNQEIKEEKLPPKRVIEYGIEIAKALKSVHDAGIIHRDIKPHNIYIHREIIDDETNPVRESVKLADFGMIKVPDEVKNDNNEVVVKDLGLTHVGSVMGTPKYQAPEILTRKKQESKETDIYSFGIMLYELLTKKLPYNNMGDYRELVLSASEGNIKDLIELKQEPEYADIPFGLAQLIDEMIDLDPSMRPSIDEIIERLEQLENEKPEAEKVPKREAAQGGRIPVIKEEDVQPKSTRWLKSIFSRKK